MTDLVLGHGIEPAVDACKYGRRLDAEDFGQLCMGRVAKLVGGAVYDEFIVAGISHEGAHKDQALRRAAFPLVAAPGAAGDAQALVAGNEETRSFQRIFYGFPTLGKCY